MNPYHNLSNDEMYKLPRTGEVLREIRRRVLIADYRWKAREASGAKLPATESVRYSAFKWICASKDDNGHFKFLLDLNHDRAQLALNDWHRVRVRWWDNMAAEHHSYGVSVMHAILVAQMAGMPMVAYPTLSEHFTRQELGEIKQVANWRLKCNSKMASGYRANSEHLLMARRQRSKPR